MKLTIVNETTEKLNTKRLNIALDLIVTKLRAQKIRQKKLLTAEREITFVFLTAARMRKINFQYRGKDKPTDVLSFASQEVDSLGELVFCLPVLKKQAKEHKHSLEAELIYMMIHGVLHLLGYDHELSKAEEKLMFTVQDSCFEQVCHQLW